MHRTIPPQRVQTGVRRRDRAAVRRLLAGPHDGPGGRPLVTDDHHATRPGDRSQCALEQGRATHLEGGLVGATEALRAATGQDHGVELHVRSLTLAEQHRHTGGMQVTLVQEASTLDPADNRDRLAELTPEGSDLVVFPEAFARDFGEPGSDLSGAAEPLDGPFATEVARVADERGTTVLAGMFERGDDPARPVNTLVLRGAAHADYRKIHLYDSFGYRESDRVTAGPLTPVTVDLSVAASGSA